MNLLEQYVTNITHEERLERYGIVAYKLVADVDCYGNIQKQKEVILSEEDYKLVKECGYYMG